MAYAEWVSLSANQGSGDSTVTVTSSSNNTGRNARSTTITFKAVNCEDVPRTVNQAGKPEFASFESTTSSVNSSGGTLTLSGASNSSELTFSKGTDNIGLTLPASYTAAGVTTTNGAAISGDPGASQEFAWSIQFSVPANTGITAKTCQIVVTDDAGHTHTCTITLAAGAATLSVSPSSASIAWDGSDSATFTVTSNTNWTIE